MDPIAIAAIRPLRISMALRHRTAGMVIPPTVGDYRENRAHNALGRPRQLREHEAR